MRGNRILVNYTELYTRIAVIQEKVLTDLFIEPNNSKGIINNIYKGRVIKILPGMQSAFVNIGLRKTAFLYVDDVFNNSNKSYEHVMEEDEDAEQIQYDINEDVIPEPQTIEKLLKDKQEIIVQISKEPIGTKGPRVTTNISLPGRNIVYLPTMNQVGVSRKIMDTEERERLKKIAEDVKKEDGGLIIRTVAEGKKKEDFEDDIKFLSELWKHILEENEKKDTPSLLHEDLDVVLKVIRDYMNSEFEEVLIDDEKIYKRVLKFVKKFMPHYQEKIQMYAFPTPIFERYNIDSELVDILKRKVNLESGGTIIIDETEALTAIDVNTGSFVGKGTNVEDTILKTNLEAAIRIAHELRLRNIGGIIVIDFIDMKNEEHRERVYQTMIDELSTDRARTNVLKISELGLIQLTRKRTRKSLKHFLGTECSYCSGKGFHKAPKIIINDILVTLKKLIIQTTKNSITIEANPLITKQIFEDYMSIFDSLENRYNKNIVLRSVSRFELEKFRVKV